MTGEPALSRPCEAEPLPAVLYDALSASRRAWSCDSCGRPVAEHYRAGPAAEEPAVRIWGPYSRLSEDPATD